MHRHDYNTAARVHSGPTISKSEGLAAGSPELHVRRMVAGDADEVARLHALTINRGFLARLGRRFLCELYLGILQDPESSIWVVERGGRVRAFLAYAKSLSGLYRRVLRSRSWRMALAMFPRILHPRFLKHALETWHYPSTQSELRLPEAELLALGVHPELRGRGAGRLLVDQMLARARQDGQREIKVIAGADLDDANAFYQRLGFRHLTQFEHHGRISNVYVISVESAA